LSRAKIYPKTPSLLARNVVNLCTLPAHFTKYVIYPYLSVDRQLMHTYREEYVRQDAIYIMAIIVLKISPGVGKAGRHLERGASIPYNGLEVKVI